MPRIEQEVEYELNMAAEVGKRYRLEPETNHQEEIDPGQTFRQRARQPTRSKDHSTT